MLWLFGLNDDELLPDLRITGAGALRAGLGAHQEHWVNQDAQAADRKKVPAEVTQVASHEVDTDSDKDESIVATSGSEGSESASESELFFCSMLLRCDLLAKKVPAERPTVSVSWSAFGRNWIEAKKCEWIGAERPSLFAGLWCWTVWAHASLLCCSGRDFKDQEDFIGSEHRKLQRLELVPERWPLARLSFSLQKCVDHPDRVLAGLGGLCNTGRSEGIAVFPSPSV